MKILCIYRSCGPATVAKGWQNVFESCGHQFRYWHRDRGEAAFDVFNSFKPDLFIGTTWDADEALLKLCRRYAAMKVVLYAATWGPLSDEVPAEYPIVRITDREKVLLERMKRETGRPDLVWLHLTPSYVDPMLGGYRSIGILPAGITNAADLFTYSSGVVKDEYQCDVAWCGGAWGYKMKLLGPYLFPLLHPDHPAKLRAKCWGNQTWAAHNYLGLLDEGEAKHVFRSALVAPSIGEPHSLIFSDIVERHYKVPCAGGLVVGGPEVGLEEEFGPGVIPRGNTPQAYQDLIVHYSRCDESERRQVASLQQDAVFCSNTYHDRVQRLFTLLNLPAESERARESKRNVLSALAPLG